LEFGFSLAPWSQKYYEALNKILYDREIEHETQPTGDEIVTSFITVDLKQDLSRAMELARIVLLEVLMLRPDDRVRIYLNNIDPREIKVGF
jgi:hypothetical protein